LLDFCKVGGWGHPCHRTLSTCVIGNVFEPFMILFMSELAAISFCAQFAKRSVHGGLARYKTASPNRELLCPQGSRKSADPPVRDRIGEHPPSNQSLTSASQSFGHNLPGKRSGPRGFRIGYHRLQSSRHTHGQWLQTHPLNPAASGFRNPRQLITFTNSCAEPNRVIQFQLNLVGGVRKWIGIK
jgi:hypothetical protein